MSTIPFRERLSCTINAACEATGIGRTKLYEKIATGEVLTTNVDGRRLVLVRSLLHLVDPPVAAAGEEKAA